MAEMLTPPEPVYLDGPGTLRWAAGRPDGPRSLTWSVIGGGDGSVYVGTRSTMHDMKLSLHPNRWRMALTDRAARNQLAPDQDRVLTRWEIPAEMAPGWRLAAVIFTPSTTFREPFDEPSTSDRRPILWFPAPRPPEHLRFYVLLGDPETPDNGLTVNDVIGDVGRMTLKDGRRVWVIADFITMTDEHQQAIDGIRNRLAGQADAASVGWGWGEVNGAPNLLDLASVLPRTE